MQINLPKKKFFYNCDGFYDVGWGCVYRCLQNVIYFLLQREDSILSIMKFLKIEYDPFIQTRQLWIEPIDCKFYLKEKYKIASKLILYLPNDTIHMLRSKKNDFDQIYKKNNIISYLKNKAWCPIIIDDGTYSYMIYKIDEKNVYFLDPHRMNNDQLKVFSIETFLKRDWMILLIE